MVLALARARRGRSTGTETSLQIAQCPQLGLDLGLALGVDASAQDVAPEVERYLEDTRSLREAVLPTVALVTLLSIAPGILMMVGTLIHGLRKGKRAMMNPWGGATLEWFVPSPPPTHLPSPWP